MANYYITINRQFGSLGRPIAIKLAEILGIEYYDRDIVEETAKQMNIPLSQASEQEETIASRFGRMAFPLGQGSTENQQQMFDVQTKIIQDLAAKGSAIFVGRCADYVLQNYNCLRVFIYAPKAKRYLNCVNSLEMTPTEAKRMIDRVDKARDRYCKKYARHLPSDPEYTHLMVDSSLFGVTGTAELLATVAREYFMTDLS